MKKTPNYVGVWQRKLGGKRGGAHSPGTTQYIIQVYRKGITTFLTHDLFAESWGDHTAVTTPDKLPAFTANCRVLLAARMALDGMTRRVRVITQKTPGRSQPTIYDVTLSNRWLEENGLSTSAETVVNELFTQLKEDKIPNLFGMPHPSNSQGAEAASKRHAAYIQRRDQADRIVALEAALKELIARIDDLEKRVPLRFVSQMNPEVVVTMAK